MPHIERIGTIRSEYDPDDEKVGENIFVDCCINCLHQIYVLSVFAVAAKHHGAKGGKRERKHRKRGKTNSSLERCTFEPLQMTLIKRDATVIDLPIF